MNRSQSLMSIAIVHDPEYPEDPDPHGRGQQNHESLTIADSQSQNLFTNSRFYHFDESWQNHTEIVENHGFLLNPCDCAIGEYSALLLKLHRAFMPIILKFHRAFSWEIPTCVLTSFTSSNNVNI